MNTATKSGISGARAYRIQEKLKVRLLDIISMGISFKMTHEDITDRIRGQVMGDEYHRAPRYVRSYIQGVWETKREEINHYHLVWMLWCGGKLMTHKEVDSLTEQEKCFHKYQREGTGQFPRNYQSPWSRINGALSRHVWKDAEGKPLVDKPYGREFLPNPKAVAV
jgi:hypothetical protein